MLLVHPQRTVQVGLLTGLTKAQKVTSTLNATTAITLRNQFGVRFILMRKTQVTAVIFVAIVMLCGQKVTDMPLLKLESSFMNILKTLNTLVFTLIVLLTHFNPFHTSLSFTLKQNKVLKACALLLTYTLPKLINHKLMPPITSEFLKTTDNHINKAQFQQMKLSF